MYFLFVYHDRGLKKYKLLYKITTNKQKWERSTSHISIKRNIMTTIPYENNLRSKKILREIKPNKKQITTLHSCGHHVCYTLTDATFILIYLKRKQEMRDSSRGSDGR